MKDPPQVFSEGFRGFYRTSNMLQDNIIVLDPLLQIKVLDIHMTASLLGLFHVRHRDGGGVVFV
jgi:hypothetical protein